MAGLAQPGLAARARDLDLDLDLDAKSGGGVSAVSMLQNSMQNHGVHGHELGTLERMASLRLDALDALDDEEDLEPARVSAIVAESLGLEEADDAQVSALMKQSLAVAERLAAASLLTSEAAKRRLQARCIDLEDRGRLGKDGKEDPEDGGEYVPPRALLLYLVRMGSFSSAPRVLNPDSQDDGLDMPTKPTRADLLSWCERHLQGTPAKLLSRRMLPVEGRRPPGWADKGEDNSTIRVMQWNVLSQSLGSNIDNFVACPDEALDWGVRRALMLQEVATLEPDIICLQEVDHYKVLERALGPLGYSGLWEPKPDSPCLYLQDNNGPDGCALLWRTDRFTLLHQHRATLHVWRIPSNQVVLIAVLRHIATGVELCVATTHLKARAGALMSTLRNEQGRDLVRVVSAQAAGRPVLLAGDLNAEPVEPVYRTVLQHPSLRLTSAYSKASHQEEPESELEDPVAQSAAGEPLYTTWKVREEGEQCHTIDYLFFSRPAFSVSALLEFPSGDDIGAGRVPSFQYPSDHFSLCADLRLRETRPIGRCAGERTK